MSASFWIVATIAIVGIVVASTVVLVVVLIRFARQLSKPFPDGVITSGEVVGHVRLPTGSSESAGFAIMPIFRFDDVDGVTRTSRDQISDQGRLALGTWMEISYRPVDPTRVRRLHRHRTTGPPVVLKRSPPAPPPAPPPPPPSGLGPAGADPLRDT